MKITLLSRQESKPNEYRYLSGSEISVKAIFLIIVMFCLHSYAASETEDINVLADQISSYIEAGNYLQAETLARKALKIEPDDLYFLSQLDVSLNGQGKTDEAEKVRDKILDIWHREKKAKWVEKGSPVGESSWARIIEQHDNYLLVVSEYYTPQILRSPPLETVIKVYYKCIIFPKHGEKTARIFKLEHSNFNVGDYYTLRESLPNGGAQSVIYGSVKPTIRQIATDTAAYIDKHDK